MFLRARHSQLQQKSLAVIVLCIFGLLAKPTEAQNYLTQTGNPTFTSAWPVELGYVNVGNGNLHMDITISTIKERGNRPFVAKLDYDSRIWQVVSGTSNAWQPTNVQNSQGGWRFVTSGDPGFIGYLSGSQTCIVNHARVPSGIAFNSFSWTSPDGTQRFFPLFTRMKESCGVDVPNGNAFATDSSGFHMFVTNYTHAIVYAPDGTQVSPTVKDTNGNYFSTDSNGNVIDTLGRTPVTTTVNGNQTTYAVLNAKGSRSTFVVTTESISVATAFQVSGVTEFSGTLTVIRTLQLPDGNTYTFGYDSYGELDSVTLPTGGLVSYGYSNLTDGLSGVNRWVTSHASGGGTTTFGLAVVPISNCASGSQACQSQTVAKPDGSQAIYTFSLNNGAWTSQVQYKSAGSASSILATISDTWNFANSCQLQNCTGSQQIQKLTETTTFPGPSGGVSRTLQWTYDNANDTNVSTLKEWKYYLGGQPTIPDRETDFTYQTAFAYASKNIINRVLSATTKDGSGNVLAQTNFSYDDSGALLNSTPSSGIANHDDANFGLANTVRGNLTKLQQCTNVVGCTTNFLQSALIYDTTGQILSIQDPNGNVTSFSYADNFFNDIGDGPSNPPSAFSPASATNAYLTSVSSPLIPPSKFGYYWGTGQRALATDANGNTAFGHFFDSFSRPTSTVLPNGGWSFTSYASSETRVDSYTGITAAFSTSGGAGIRQDEVLLDNLSRRTTQELVSDPEGPTFAATTYDSSGRIQNGSHPYRSTSDATYGLETPAYDGLNRVTKITHPDSSSAQVFFGTDVSGGGRTSQLCSTATYGTGFPVLSADETGRKRQSWIGAFGSAIELDEPDSSGNLTSATCYQYDALGRLTQITHGNQTRSTSYDSLSRVTAVSAPETGTINFFYTTASGTLCSGAPAALCRSVDARGITKTLSYDALNRITGVSYSDSTPSVSYSYDQGTNAQGQTQKGFRTGMSDSAGTVTWTHDSVGRILTQSRTLGGILTETISYSYNLDGSIATLTYPSGRKINYTVNNAERLTAATDAGTGTIYGTAASYAATGALQGLISGKMNGGFNGITEAHAYNNRLEYVSTSASSANGTALNLAFSYSLPTGNNGSVSSITNNVDTGRTQNFQYDPLNRITSAASQASGGSDCWGQSFGVDAFANLTAMTTTQCTGFPLSTSANANNQLAILGYDSAGNTTGDGNFTYFYDAESRVAAVSGMAGGPYCYGYDGDGLRVAKTHANGGSCSSTNPNLQVDALYWRSIGGDTLAETDDTGATLSEYVYLAGRRLARIDASGNVFYYFPDPLGSTRTITDSTGHVCYDADFTPYGDEINHVNACPQNYKFTGYERDAETGNDYAFARFYSPRLGRFLSPDPLPGSLADPQSLNRYAYVTNNPINFADPSGMVTVPRPGGGGGGGINIGELLEISLGLVGANGGFGSGWNEFDILGLQLTGELYHSDDPNFAFENYSSSQLQSLAGDGVIDDLGQVSVSIGELLVGDNTKPWQLRSNIVGLLRGKNDCSAWFNRGTGSAADIMSNVPIVSYTPKDPSYDMPDASVGINPQMIFINSLGRFYTDRYNFNDVGGVYPAGSNGARATILLHELAHIVQPPGFIASDASVPGASEKNTQLLLQNCEKAINGRH